MYQNDLMLLASANEESLELLENQILHFGEVSGLVANRGKSSVYFGGFSDAEETGVSGDLSLLLCNGSCFWSGLLFHFPVGVFLA
ncbi:hypothetical protein Dimus_039815 [Dionaea muscipula]